MIPEVEGQGHVIGDGVEGHTLPGEDAPDLDRGIEGDARDPEIGRGEDGGMMSCDQGAEEAQENIL